MLLHPSYVHISTPDAKQTTVPFKKSKSRITAEEKALSPLQADVLEPLQRQGILADTLTTGPQKWQGIVRIPQRNAEGKWETQQQRVEAVKSMEGSFKRADLK